MLSAHNRAPPPPFGTAEPVLRGAFVAAGFEHSIANLYFVPVALFHRLFARPSFWNDSSTTADQYRAMTWSRFITRNLAPVTLGNIVGGGLLVGLTYWFVYLRPSDESRSPDRNT